MAEAKRTLTEEPKRLSEVPFRQRWPNGYSMKGTILTPVKPPGKGRSTITFEAEVPLEFITILLQLMSFPLKDPQLELLKADLKAAAERFVGRDPHMKEAKEKALGDKKKDATPSKGKNNARKSRSVTSPEKEGGKA